MAAALIVLTGSLGDVVRGLMLVEPLRHAGYRVGWFVDSRWARIVQLHPGVSQVHEFERARGVAGFLSSLRTVRRERYDLALDLQRIAKSGIAAWASGARRRIGFHPTDTKELNWIWNNERIPRFGERRPKAAQYLTFLTHLGITLPTSLSSGLETHSGQALLGELAPQFPTAPVALLLGSAWQSKDLPVAGYYAIVRRILDSSSAPIVLLGDKGRRSHAEEICRAVSSDRVFDYTGQTTLIQLTGALKASRVLVGPDSGPAHLAAAVGTPTITLFGPTDPSRTAPVASDEVLCRDEEEERRYLKRLESRVVRSVIGCAPCYRRRCPGLDTLCMRTLPMGDVFQALVPYLGLRPQDSSIR